MVSLGEIKRILGSQRTKPFSDDKIERTIRKLFPALPGEWKPASSTHQVPAEDGSEDEPLWGTPIQRTVATEGTGVPELVSLITDHRTHLESTGELDRRSRARLISEVETLVQEGLVHNWQQSLGEGEFQAIMAQVFERQISPGEAARKLIGMEEAV